VCPTQAIEIFGTISTPCMVRWPLTFDLKVIFYGDRRRGTPPSGVLNARGLAKYSDCGPIEGYISETAQVTINEYDKKSHMSFRLAPKSVTSNDLERRSPNRSVNFIEFGRFRDGLRKSGWRYTDTFCGRNAGQRIKFLVI